MTNAELKEAMLKGEKIIYTYLNEKYEAEKITAIIYRISEKNRINVQVEVMNKQNCALIVNGRMCSRKKEYND